MNIALKNIDEMLVRDDACLEIIKIILSFLLQNKGKKVVGIENNL
jgi:hypothetical protein